jgi:hypothetical protein
MTAQATANGWIVVEDNVEISDRLFLTEQEAERWIDACLEERARRACVLRPDEIPG